MELQKQVPEHPGPQLPGTQSNSLQPEAANTGVRTLVRTGTVHAIAAPVPMRLSIRRREIGFPLEIGPSLLMALPLGPVSA
jgi:hypothetical protein